MDILLFAVGWAHVLLAPYAKVEESFNLHAVHDVLLYGIRSDTLHNVRRSLMTLTSKMISNLNDAVQIGRASCRERV